MSSTYKILYEKTGKKNSTKHFTVKNEGFLCKNCHAEVPPQKSSCRNHCTHCLYSLHVDESYPGDRLSTCHGLMEPLEITYSGKKGFIIVHQCLTCKKIMKNKTAPDDTLDSLINRMRSSEIHSKKKSQNKKYEKR
ncbi:RNHCP domain-containing protein [Candidatus Peregrinibacteria bacterium]|nr:RNHCP domain-containing protein [Candidatus Peregrinibacteria bacterium]